MLLLYLSFFLSFFLTLLLFSLGVCNGAYGLLWAMIYRDMMLKISGSHFGIGKFVLVAPTRCNVSQVRYVFSPDMGVSGDVKLQCLPDQSKSLRRVIHATYYFIDMGLYIIH